MEVDAAARAADGALRHDRAPAGAAIDMLGVAEPLGALRVGFDDDPLGGEAHEVGHASGGVRPADTPSVSGADAILPSQDWPEESEDARE